jgi:23S rRNA (uracil1939-C5)-methyltransferase
MVLPRLLEVGQEAEIRIESMGHRGEGVGRYQGLAVFVPGTVPGELVRVKITEVKKNYARGTCLEVRQPSLHRVEECCAGPRQCGGCQLLHISYEEQLRLKRDRVAQALARIGGLADIPVKPVLGMAHPWGYRNKAVFHPGRAGEKITLGFYREQSHLVADIGACKIVPADMLEVAGVAAEALSHLYAGNLDNEADAADRSEAYESPASPGRPWEKDGAVST